MTRERADMVLVRRGLFTSRARAQEAIAAGLVTADGHAVTRPSDRIARDARIEATRPHPYVSRGGVKLAAALDAFAIDPAGLSCLDCGASTGGFTDVLLRRGAAFVHAVDVGSGQFSPALAGPRVGLREGTDIRSLAAGALDPVPSLAAVDVSFISLKLVLPSVAGLLAPACRIVALVKPQFEAGRGNLGKGGVVREASVRERTVEGIADALGALGFRVAPALPSPIAGGDGNVEFLVAAWRDRA